MNFHCNGKMRWWGCYQNCTKYRKIYCICIMWTSKICFPPAKYWEPKSTHDSQMSFLDCTNLLEQFLCGNITTFILVFSRKKLTCVQPFLILKWAAVVFIFESSWDNLIDSFWLKVLLVNFAMRYMCPLAQSDASFLGRKLHTAWD